MNLKKIVQRYRVSQKMEISSQQQKLRSNEEQL